jgi:hypothetical protein
MIKTIIVNTEPLPTYNTVLGRLLRVEADHKAAETSSAFMAGPAGRQQGGYRNRGGYGAAGHSANNPYNSSSGGYDSDNDDSNSSMGEEKDKQGIRCHYCHKKGHLKKECYKLKNDRAARSGGSNSGGGGGGYRGGGTANNGRRPRTTAFMVGTGSTESDSWLLDSAAGRHLTTDLSVLGEIYTLPTPVEVKFANGHTELATQAGKVTLHHSYTGNTMTLKGVLYAPCDEVVNLITLGRIVASNAAVTFAKGCGIITGDDGFTAYAPYTADGLYALADWYPVRPSSDGNSSSSSSVDIGSTSAAMKVNTKQTAELWHSRLGHVGYDSLSRLLRQEMVTGMELSAADIAATEQPTCGPCEKGRMTRKPFPSSTTQVDGPLDLVHMDLCGPIEESRGGNKYIATFKDDYTGMSWIELTATKKNLAEVIKARLNLLQTQKDKTIKVIRTDNGKEYVNEQLGSYLRDKGIKHEHSMPCTPQQNGEAERLNRTLLEKARPMLSEAQLPLDMWAEAVVTANYLRTVSPVKGKAQTPWELYYGNKPDLSHLRCFGSRAYVLIPKQLRKHKMAEISRTGLMVGYAVNGKGWRILMDDDGEVVSSRDVTFDESSFPGSPWFDMPALDTDSDSESEDGGDADAGGSDDEEEEVNPQPGTDDSQPSDSSTPPPTPAAPAGPSSTPVPPDAPRAARNRQTPKYLQGNYYMVSSGAASAFDQDCRASHLPGGTSE